MDDDVVRVASCGVAVTELGTHGSSCRFSKGRLNDVIKRAKLDSAKIPCHLEPTGLHRSDEKRLGDASVVLWRCRRVLVWDATYADTIASSPYWH